MNSQPSQNRSNLTAGSIVGHYEIIRKLGEGAAGSVYLGLDSRLNRQVALKFLGRNVETSSENLDRFQREAKITASIDHPNVCTIYDIGEAYGEIYFAMAFVDGESLEEKMAGGAFDVTVVQEIGIQVASGLKAAHDKGVIHRDIKPSNIMLTRADFPKIVDFGLALLPEAIKLTMDKSTLGTPAYMSPEQARGDKIDHRTDIWSLGVTLFEMLTDRRPFDGPSLPSILHSIVYDDIEWTEFNADSGIGLFRGVLKKALAKNPSDRYDSLSEMVEDLNDLASSSIRLWGIADAALAKLPCLAVFPFVNMSRSEEDEYFSDGITDELISSLAQAKNLKVVSRTSVFGFKGKPIDVREFGKKLGATAVIEGSIRRAGESIKVSVQLVNVSDGINIWSSRFDRNVEDIFEIQDEITLNVIENLTDEGSMDSNNRVVESEHSFEAYDLFLKGRFNWNKQTEEGIIGALQFFNQSIELDPKIAASYSGLADVYSLSGFRGITPSTVALKEAKKFAQRALTLEPTLVDANISMAYVRQYLEWDWDGAETYIRQAIQLSPSGAQGYYVLSALLCQQAKFNQARSAIEKAIELDPLNPTFICASGWTEYYADRPELAQDIFNKALELNPHYPEFQLALGAVYERLGRFDEAIECIEACIDKFGADPLAIAFLGAIYGSSGDVEKANDTLATMEEMAKERHVPAICRSIVYFGLKDKENSLLTLAMAVKNRDPYAGWLKVLPLVSWLRADTEFVSILNEIGFKD